MFLIFGVRWHPSLGDHQSRKEPHMHNGPTRIVLVTGGSRGIGAEVARQFADPDTHVIVNYREKASRANTIAAAIRDAGGHASTMGADISNDVDATAMIDSVRSRLLRLDGL